jgi:hypothetical protein
VPSSTTLPTASVWFAKNRLWLAIEAVDVLHADDVPCKDVAHGEGCRRRDP